MGQFTTLLAREVVLEKEYDVGLSEIMVPFARKSRNCEESIMYTEGFSDPGYFRISTSLVMLPDDIDQLKMLKTRTDTPAFD